MARTYAEQIRTSQTTPDTAMYTYKACFLKAIEYSMPVTNFTEEEWNTIMAPALKATLNKSAMATNFPRDVLYGPDLYEGMDIQHPYYQQGIQKIITCIQESAIGSRTGELIKFNAEEFMLESGIPFRSEQLTGI